MAHAPPGITTVIGANSVHGTNEENTGLPLVFWKKCTPTNEWHYWRRYKGKLHLVICGKFQNEVDLAQCCQKQS